MVGVIAAAIFTGLAFVQTRRQANEAVTQTEIARDALLAGNRAWLSLDVDPASDLRSTKDGESIDVTIRAQNFGHSPALNVTVEAVLYPSPLFGPAMGIALNNACHRGDKGLLLNTTKSGRIVVPGSPAIWTSGASASTADINMALKTINEKSATPFRFLPTQGHSVLPLEPEFSLPARLVASCGTVFTGRNPGLPG